MGGLRAISCLTVFLANLHHSMGRPTSGRAGPLDLATFAESGIGVVIFMVLSGALLSMPFWRRLERGVSGSELRRFMLRRFVRIAPPYYLCLLAFILGAGLWRDPADVAAHVLFVNNLWDRSFYSVSPQFWTIGMFVQFYLVLPLLFAVAHRISRRAGPTLLLFAAAAAGFYATHAILMATRHTWLTWPISAVADVNGFALSHSTLAHLPHFVFGVLAGYALLRLAARVTEDRSSIDRMSDLLFWTASAALIAICSVPAATRLEVPYGRYLFPWMPALAAIVVITAPFGPTARKTLEARPLRWLGLISYGVYIYHVPCMQVVQKLTQHFNQPLSTLQFAGASLALTFVVAAVSRVIIERPLLRWSGSTQF